MFRRKSRGEGAPQPPLTAEQERNIALNAEIANETVPGVEGTAVSDPSVEDAFFTKGDQGLTHADHEKMISDEKQAEARIAEAPEESEEDLPMAEELPDEGVPNIGETQEVEMQFDDEDEDEDERKKAA